MKTLIKNGNLLTPFREIKNGGLLLEDEKIAMVLENEMNVKQIELILQEQKDIQYDIIDAKGNYIAPGFIDIHTHGAGGHDFMDGTVEAILEAARAHMQHGTTSLVPTTLTSSLKELFKMLDNFKMAKENKDGPELLGLHLEGPYFSMEQRGAQDPQFIKNPEREEYVKILDYSKDIIRWTVAPELEGAMKMGRELKSRGVLPSIGHSNAIYQEVQQAFENGYTHVTHLYSGMSMVRRINAYRYAGVVESAYLIDEMTVEIIADGKHLPQSLLQLIYKIKGPDKICLITDSMRAAGMPEGEYILGSLGSGQKIIVEDGVAKLLDHSAFAGSVATTDTLVKTMIEIADVSVTDAVRMMTITPARIIGVANRKGSLSVGKDADIVIFDDSIEPKSVITKGKVQFNYI